MNTGTVIYTWLMGALVGIDEFGHERFTVKHRGLDERLTGVQDKAHLVRQILA